MQKNRIHVIILIVGFSLQIANPPTRAIVDKMLLLAFVKDMPEYDGKICIRLCA